MINTSNAYKRAIEKNREFRIRDRITFRDGTYADISMEDIMSYKINEATSSSGKFEIGAAVMKEYAITLSNMDGKFDLYDFEDADIQAVVGLKLADNTWEDLRKGTYRVFDTVFNDVTLQITAYDGMLFFDRPYSGCKLNYPATILEIIQSACQDCQMTFDASTVEMGNYIVAERPDDTSLTYRDMIAYCAQIMGRFARINHLGALSFGWYPFEVIPLGGLDGGVFDDASPYTSGDTADGGNFDNYSSGGNYDAGSFTDTDYFHHFYNLRSQSINAVDISVTGIQVSIKSSGTEEKSCFYGQKGYVLEIKDNPLIQENTMMQVAEQIGRKIINKPFRPMSITVQSDPSIEAGDIAVVTVRKQQSYTTVITETTFSMGASQPIACTAETPAAKTYQRFSAYTKLLDEARENTGRQLSSYDIAVQQMNQLAANTFGYHFTVVKQDDGSIVSYQHDKPTLAESKVVYKKGIDGFFVTRNYTGNDSTTVWTSGFDNSGNAVLNILNAIGINFGWARGGVLTLGGKNNGNGVLQVLDSNGNLKAQLDMVSFNVNGGNIILNMDGSFIAKKATIYGDGEFSGNLKAATGTFKGELKAATGSFSGEVNADSGKVGGWVIKNNYIQSKDGTITLYSNGLIEIGDVILSSSGKAMTAKYGLHVYAGTYQFSDGSDSIKFFNLPHVTNGEHLVFGSDGSTVCYSSSSSLRYKSVGKKVTSEDVEPLYTLPVNWAKYKEGYLSGDDERDGTYYPMFIAEEVHNHFPLAADHKNGKPENWNHRILIPCMMKMLQDQKKRNDEQDKTISELKDRISRLEERIGGGTNGNPKQERTL